MLLGAEEHWIEARRVVAASCANTGDTCFGDSGGPNFIGTSNVTAGVTSFGLNGTCGGTGGVFRVDRSWSLDWINTYLHPVTP